MLPRLSYAIQECLCFDGDLTIHLLAPLLDDLRAAIKPLSRQLSGKDGHIRCVAQPRNADSIPSVARLASEPAALRNPQAQGFDVGSKSETNTYTNKRSSHCAHASAGLGLRSSTTMQRTIQAVDVRVYACDL